MPTEMINEILNGNNGVIAFSLLVLWRFHHQAMKRMDTHNDKLDVVADNIVKMDKNVEKHTVELEYGTKEMARIDEHNKAQDALISENRDSIHKLKGSSLKLENINDIVKAIKH